MDRQEIAGNQDTGLLKIIALMCMIVDHVGARLYPRVTELRILGRVAFPLYMWCLVVGICFTRSRARYALRLLLVGLIAQPFYMLGLNHAWNQLSVFATLRLGYLGMWGIRENRYGSRFWAPVLVLMAPCFVSMDYGWRGVLLIMLLYLSRRQRGAVLAVMVGYCLFWGANSSAVQQVFGLSLREMFWYQLEFASCFLRLQGMAVLAVPLMIWPRRRRTPLPKWVGYAAYPGHLLILWLVQMALGVTTWQQSLRLLIPRM